MNIKQILFVVVVSLVCVNCKPNDDIPTPQPVASIESKLFEGLQTLDTTFSLIPQPKELITYKASLDLATIDTIYIENESLRPVATYMQSALMGYLEDGIKIVIGNTKCQHSINILLDPLSNNAEHYKLGYTNSSAGP